MRLRALPFLLAVSAVVGVGAGDISRTPWPTSVYGSLIVDHVTPYEVVHDLTGWWQFDEGTGSAAGDSSSAGNDGTLQNMEEGDWVSGISGSGLDFDGTDEYVDVGSSSTLKPGTGDMSWAWWVDPDVDDTGDTFFGDRPLGAGGTQEGYGFGAMGNPTAGRFTALLEASDGSYKNYGADSVFSASEGWFHMAVTWDRSADALTVYKDGSDITSSLTKSVDDDLSAKDISNTENLLLGWRPSASSRQYNGQMDAVRICQCVWTAAEVTAIYNARR